MQSPRIRDLGPLRITVDDVERPCSGAKQAAILATLAMHAGRRVPLADLVAAAWGEDATVTVSSLENHVWRLRQLLGPARPGSGRRPLVVNEAGGYRLVLGVDDVDSLRFVALAERVRDAPDDDVVARCDEALELWRGDPFEAVVHVTTAAAAAVARLEELRGQLQERRLDALLRRDELDAVLVDLEPLLIAHPFRERLWELRMTALARSGRVEEALAAFRRVRTLLREELGLEPGPALQELQRAVMARDAEVIRPPTTGAATGPSVRGPGRDEDRAPLPRWPRTLIGRHTELEALGSCLDTAALVTVTGPGGCGKTRLAAAAARNRGDRHPDGVRFVDLTELPAGSGRHAIADLVVTTLGLTAPGGDGTAALRGFCGDQQALLVLDNREHVLEGVAAVLEDVLRAGQRVTVLTTSREPLEVGAETVWTLEPLSLLPAADGSPSAAAELFAARAGAAAAVRPDLVEQVCARVDGLPLAIELAAARSRAFTLEEIADQVAGDPGGLGRIGRGPADHRGTLRSTIDWSHRLLGEDERLVHRRLAVVPGAFTLSIAEATVGPDVPAADVPTLLTRLAHRSLLFVRPPTRAGGHTTFRQLETVRAHARHVLVAAGEEEATRRRRDAWVHRLVADRPRLGRPEEAAWYDLVEENHPAVRATLDTTLEDRDPAALVGAAGLIWFWYYRSRVHEGVRWLQRAAECVEGHRDAPVVDAALAAALQLLVRPAEASEPLRRALAGANDVSAAVRPRLVEVLVGAAAAAWTLDDWAVAAEICVHLQQLVRDDDDPDLRLVADAVACASDLGATTAAEQRALALRAERLHHRAVELDNVCATWICGAVRNITALLEGDPQAGLQWTDRVIAATRRLGAGGGGVYTEALANFLVMTGNPEEAVRLYASASVQNRRDGMIWPARPVTRDLLARTGTDLTPDVYARAWEEGERFGFDDVVARSRLRGPSAPQRPDSAAIGR